MRTKYKNYLQIPVGEIPQSLENQKILIELTFKKEKGLDMQEVIDSLEKPKW